MIKKIMLIDTSWNNLKVISGEAILFDLLLYNLVIKEILIYYFKLAPIASECLNKLIINSITGTTLVNIQQSH